ncbi:MAG: hypothetical protein LC676_16530 [Loktanella sp.]|nr:hypothetical protein [Loktanella sp.]
MKIRFIQKVLRNTPAGIFIGFVAGMILAAALDAGISEEIKKLYTFIISAILSLMAAALTLIGVFANIENQRETERRSREKKLAAAKALLPASLAQMCSVCKSGMQFSDNFSEFAKKLSNDEFEEISTQRLSLSDGNLSIFREVIELTDNDAVSERLTVMLREYQVFFSRWIEDFGQEYKRAVKADGDNNTRTVEWAFLFAITVSLFDYARNEAVEPNREIGKREIWNALGVSHILSVDRDKFNGAIEIYSRAL